MIKNIIIVVCLFVSVTFIIYGQIKANEAMKNMEVAQEAQQMAQEQAQEAADQMARQQEVVNKLQAELDACKSN